MKIYVHIMYKKCIQNFHEIGTEEEGMFARVYFDLVFPDKTYSDLFCDIKLTSGDNYETGSIEVQRPNGYNGPFDYKKFRDSTEKYYRHLIGSKGNAINIPSNVKVKMKNNVINIPAKSRIIIDDDDNDSW